MIWGTPTSVIDIWNVPHQRYFFWGGEETKLITNAHSLQQIFVKTIFLIPFCIFILKNLVVSEIIHNFANESQPSWKPMGQRGGQDTYINKKAYLALWFWHSENFATSTVSQKQSNGNASWGVLYSFFSFSFASICQGVNGWYYYTHTWGFQRCSFRLTGQCEGLQNVERASGLAPRFFICMQSSFKITRQEGAIGKNVFLFMKTTFTL